VDEEGYCKKHEGGGIQRGGTVDPARLRRRTMMEEAVEYVPAGVYVEDNHAGGFKHPEYTHALPVPTVRRRERSGSSRMMKRLEYRTHAANEGSDRGSHQGSYQGSWSQPHEWSLSLRPWRPSTPYC
jgi:hypothetical protein